jgi:hypothetical protein
LSCISLPRSVKIKVLQLHLLRVRSGMRFRATAWLAIIIRGMLRWLPCASVPLSVTTCRRSITLQRFFMTPFLPTHSAAEPEFLHLPRHPKTTPLASRHHIGLVLRPKPGNEARLHGGPSPVQIIGTRKAIPLTEARRDPKLAEKYQAQGPLPDPPSLR